MIAHVMRCGGLVAAALLLLTCGPAPLVAAKRAPIDVFDFSGLPTAAASVRSWERGGDTLRYHDRGTKRCDKAPRRQRSIVMCLMDPDKSSFTVGNGRKGGAMVHVSLSGDPVYDGNTICHELGHALGIPIHPPIGVPVAAACMQDDSARFTPGPWDLAQLPAEKRKRGADQHKRGRR